MGLDGGEQELKALDVAGIPVGVAVAVSVIPDHPARIEERLHVLQARVVHAEELNARIEQQGLQPLPLQQRRGMRRRVTQGRAQVLRQQRPGAVGQLGGDG